VCVGYNKTPVVVCHSPSHSADATTAPLLFTHISPHFPHTYQKPGLKTFPEVANIRDWLIFLGGDL
jgi:hypothetical protein